MRKVCVFEVLKKLAYKEKEAEMLVCLCDKRLLQCVTVCVGVRVVCVFFLFVCLFVLCVCLPWG